MADEISDLRLFVRMVAAGSLSETARRLNASLPAMSRRLAAMENRLGARLIERSTRRFALTEEGNLLYERGLLILAELDQTEAEVGARILAPQGHIRVGAPLEIGRRRIAPLVADFASKYPRVTIELTLNDSPADVIGSDLDVALHIDEPQVGEIITRKLLHSRRVVCASPAYLAAHGAPQRPEDPLPHDCIRLVRDGRVIDHWKFKDQGAPLTIQVRGSLSTNNAEVMHDWAVNGRGIGLKALWDIQDDLANGNLVELLAPFAQDGINLYVIYPTRSHLPNRVRAFIDFVAEAFTEDL